MDEAIVVRQAIVVRIIVDIDAKEWRYQHAVEPSVRRFDDVAVVVVRATYILGSGRAQDAVLNARDAVVVEPVENAATALRDSRLGLDQRVLNRSVSVTVSEISNFSLVRTTHSSIAPSVSELW
jgi:hypothetical protein